ncbi:hypothetical protein [Maribacter forsetii]|uniref:hypothetical protein n=1 Tax=Maribacter forsetii TaxID=444515 RepID=UPI000564A37B|nr:hypothetical protein [Maribacter forsetii]
MAKLYKQIVLPLSLRNDVLELGMSNIQTMKAFYFIDNLITNSNYKCDSPTTYVSYSRNLFREVFNSKYQIFLKPLKESGIVECDDIFSEEAQKPLFYRVPSKYFLGNEETVKVNISYKGLDNVQDGAIISRTRDFIENLYIPYSKLEDAIEQVLYDVSTEMYRENYAIGEERIKYTDGVKTFTSYTAKAIIKASKFGRTLIEDQGNYFMMDINSYRALKRSNLEKAYKQTLENLRSGNIYVSRNRTNQRLDTNLTNMPNFIFELIANENKLKQIDAVNSQYAILANLMKNDGLLGRFIEDAQNGELYENIEKELNLEHRNDAKKGLMKIIFAPNDTKNIYKEGLENLYPELIKYSESIKYQKGYKELSIMLQNCESNLYIDHLLKSLQDLGIECTSKHDSIICRQSDVDFVEQLMKQEMLKIDFKCKLKVS